MVSFHGESGAQRGQVTCRRSLSKDAKRQFGPGSGKDTAGFEAGAGPGGLGLTPVHWEQPRAVPQAGRGGRVCSAEDSLVAAGQQGPSPSSPLGWGHVESHTLGIGGSCCPPLSHSKVLSHFGSRRSFFLPGCWFLFRLR